MSRMKHMESMCQKVDSTHVRYNIWRVPGLFYVAFGEFVPAQTPQSANRVFSAHSVDRV